MCNRANWLAMKQELAGKDWDAALNRNVDHNVLAFTTLLLSAQTCFVPQRTYTTNP